MITYFDTSSVVPLIVNEVSTELCNRAWNESTRVVCARAVHLAAAAAVRDTDLVLVTGDSDLGAAARTIGLAVLDTQA